MTETILENSYLLDNISIKDSIIGKIGNTPLIRLKSIPQKFGIDIPIFAKAEWFNPGGSVKDRPAWNMIKQGILSGELTEDKIIIDASSGNTGIALAMIGATLNFKVTLCIPKNASKERIATMKAYGANIVFTDPLEGTDGAIEKARSIVDADPDRYFYTNQYDNPANWKAHLNTTAKEIWTQTNGQISHFITGLGTSGTFTGITKGLREYNKDVLSFSVEPSTPFHGIEGLKHMKTARTPKIFDKNLADDCLTVQTSEAQKLTRQLAKQEGIFVGMSSGANLAASLQVAKRLEEGLIVTIFCDRGERYSSEVFWND